MKKSNMLIAVFAVLAAASVAKAQVNFDGRAGIKPQTLHSIFSASHQIIPEGAIKPAQAIDTVKATEKEADAEKAYRSLSYKIQKAQLAVLADINASVIRSAKLEMLIGAHGTEVWFYSGTILVLNSDLKAVFTIDDAGMLRAVASAGNSDQRNGTLAGILAEGVHTIWNSLNEYGSWPPVPDSGMANYDPVIGQDFSPGWGKSIKH